jgi:hypothetical protein
MAEQRKQNEHNNFFAGLFGGAADGGFFAKLITAISSIFSGNFGGLFTGLMGGAANNRTPDSDADAEPSFLKRSGSAVGRGLSQGGALLGRGLDALKNLIGHHESDNDYNRVFGPGVKRVPITDMTVNQVLAWQDKYVKNGSDSSAVGKYQIIRGTLRGLKTEMGLSGNELMDEAMQERMFVVLAERRGLKAFQSGKISESTFMRNLSQEWASLPKDHSGLSYYHGDGLNRAHATPASVSRALAEVRAPSAKPAPSESDPANNGVRYAEAPRTGQSLSTIPRISSVLNNASNNVEASLVQKPSFADLAPQRQVPLMSPSLAMS